MDALTPNHLGIWRVLKQHPGVTRGQLQDLTTARRGRIPYYLRELHAAGKATYTDTLTPEGQFQRLWRAL